MFTVWIFYYREREKELQLKSSKISSKIKKSIVLRMVVACQILYFPGGCIILLGATFLKQQSTFFLKETELFT